MPSRRSAERRWPAFRRERFAVGLRLLAALLRSAEALTEHVSGGGSARAPSLPASQAFDDGERPGAGHLVAGGAARQHRVVRRVARAWSHTS